MKIPVETVVAILKINVQKHQYYMHLFFVSKQKRTDFPSPACVCALGCTRDTGFVTTKAKWR